MPISTVNRSVKFDLSTNLFQQLYTIDRNGRSIIDNNSSQVISGKDATFGSVTGTTGTFNYVTAGTGGITYLVGGTGAFNYISGNSSYIKVLAGDTGSFGYFSAGTGLFPNATIQNLQSTTGSFGDLTLTSGTATNLYISSANIPTQVTTSCTATNLTATNCTGTNFRFTLATGTTGTITNLNSTKVVASTSVKTPKIVSNGGFDITYRQDADAYLLGADEAGTFTSKAILGMTCDRLLDHLDYNFANPAAATTTRGQYATSNIAASMRMPFAGTICAIVVGADTKSYTTAIGAADDNTEYTGWTAGTASFSVTKCTPTTGVTGQTETSLWTSSNYLKTDVAGWYGGPNRSILFSGLNYSFSAGDCLMTYLITGSTFNGTSLDLTMTLWVYFNNS